MSDEENETNINISANNFQNVCRFCLGEERLRSIFSKISKDVYISEIFERINLKIVENDELSQNICDSCFKFAMKVNDFIERCQQSYTFLKSLKDNTNVVERIEIQVTNNGNSAYIHPEEEQIEIKLTKRNRNNLRGTRVKQKVIYECRICYETFDMKEDYYVHRRAMKHNSVSIQKRACHICSKMFTNSKLKQHMLSHTKEKPYQCKICLQRFNVKTNLRRHTMIHTGEKPHVCDICGKAFIQAVTLATHKKIHTKREMPPPNYFPHTCNMCGRGFKRFRNYKKHLLKHDENSPTKEILDKSNEDESRKYICDICKKAYKTQSLLKTHQLIHGEKRFLCSECGKGFITKGTLDCHIRLHTGEKPYTCSICNRSFTHSTSFEAHSLMHTGKKPYQCKLCDKSFKQLTHLKYHVRTHTGERPYVCPFCQKQFALKGNLTVHTRIHTGETPYLCPDCGKGFYDSSSMKKHHKGHATNYVPNDDSNEKNAEDVLTENCLTLSN